MIVALSRYNTLKKENAELKKEIAELKRDCDYYKRKYRVELSDCVRAMRDYNNLMDEYDVLVRKAQKLQQLCKDSELYTNPFNQKDLKVMITLCHPDKHGGKKSATEMTQKLLEMRGKV
jgi:hypothetical protein